MATGAFEECILPGATIRHRQLLERKGFSRDFQQGFDAMISGQTGKVIFDWTHIA
jgi:hypothetical protein